MDILNLKKGDIIYCIKSYVETEFSRQIPHTLRKVHLHQGGKYKVEDFDKHQIYVKNDHSEFFWYANDRFDTIKEMRRIKLKKIQKNKLWKTKNIN